MNEVSGRGLYPGPRRHHRCNKTVYGNAVWQRSTPQALTRTTQQRRQHDDQRKPESSRQEHQAGGIDRKSLTEMLDGCDAAYHFFRNPLEENSSIATKPTTAPPRRLCLKMYGTTLSKLAPVTKHTIANIKNIKDDTAKNEKTPAIVAIRSLSIRVPVLYTRVRSSLTLELSGARQRVRLERVVRPRTTT